MKQSKSINKVFSKEYQNMLKLQWENALKEIYGNDPKMIKWCMSNISYLVPICGGKYIVELSKPNITSEFWFGESDMGQGPSHEENNKIMNNVRMSIEDYFKEENLSGIDNDMSKIKDIIAGKSNLTINHYLNYYRSNKDSVIHTFNFYNPYSCYAADCKPTGSVEMEKKDMKLLLEAYKLHRERFETRLDAYLKKYRNKLHIRSYWIDR